MTECIKVASEAKFAVISGNADPGQVYLYPVGGASLLEVTLALTEVVVGLCEQLELPSPAEMADAMVAMERERIRRRIGEKFACFCPDDGPVTGCVVQMFRNRLLDIAGVR